MKKEERIIKLEELSRDGFFSSSTMILGESLRDPKSTPADHSNLFGVFTRKFSELFPNPNEGELAMAKRIAWLKASKLAS
jgi:hypothetical protein